MFHVFFGNGTVAVRQKAFNFLALLEKEGYRLERIEGEEYIQGTCTDIATSVSLFGGKTVYLLDTPSMNALFNEEVLASLSLFKESTNMFVVVEQKLLAPGKKVFAKYAEHMEEITSVVEARFNAFSMADSLAQKDKKTLWLQLQDAKHAGLSAEEIIGTLWWQLKSMRVSAVTKGAAEAGMKPYPYDKAKRSLRNFKEGEIEMLSRSLLALYHDGHGGKRDIDLALEKWTLSI